MNSVRPLQVSADILEFLPASIVAALEIEIDALLAETATLSVKRILEANFGGALGGAIFADLAGIASTPNAKLVGAIVSRAAVSKACCRIRRGLNLPLRSPKNARPKRTETS